MPDRFKEQFDAINEASPRPLAYIPGDDPRFIYEKGTILARGEDAAEVAEAIGAGFERTATRERAGLVRFQTSDPGRHPTQDQQVDDALAAVGERRNGRTGAMMATRNHVISITDTVCCPGDEPDPVPDGTPLNPAPSAPRLVEGPPVRVLVVDTGLVKDIDKTFSWLTGVTTDDPLEPERGLIDLYVGHGTFIASLIKTVAPDATVEVDNLLPAQLSGARPEDKFGEDLLAVLDALPGGWPDILSLSAGTDSADGDTLMGLERFIDRLALERTLLVAAAGNNGSTQPFYPAAWAERGDHVLSVGALRSAPGLLDACFTNHGSWVKVYAPGERVTAAFTPMDDSPPVYRYQHSSYPGRCRWLLPPDAYGTCTCQSPRRTGRRTLKDSGLSPANADFQADLRTFTGLARWSGTSFATPIVAAMVVNEMIETGNRDPREAARTLIGKQALNATVRGMPARALVPRGWQFFTYQAP
ncbi:S8/S53 family peptidase [Nonomuraea soli]|uniref:Subtilisin family serine protease n=1 Tax=Nonomuraea soli TaxID=1032476 RepID=A0A7W0CH42_9ACTN|nr:S8/S53 family peptidase [Nonomuraea soli]MBA2891034.1 subtilisin family serine protease [Nonomuraea soli]